MYVVVVIFFRFAFWYDKPASQHEILWTTLFIAVVLKHWWGLKYATNLVGTMLNQYDFLVRNKQIVC